MDQLNKLKRKQNLLVLLIFILGVAIFYGNTLKNGFIHDDHGQIETNTYIQSLNYFPKVFTGCIWESAIGSCKETAYYRPLQSLVYMFTYQISQKPWMFHLVNLICFAAVVFLMFVLVKLLTKNFIIAFFSGLLFLIHPLNTEVVNWIAALPELLYTAFILLSVIFYFLYRSKRKSQYLIFTYIFYALGILSKEPAALAPLIFLTLDLTYFKKKISWFFKWKNIKQYVIYSIIFLIYFEFRVLILGGFGSISTHPMTMGGYLYTFFDLFSSYVRQLFWPYSLNFFYIFHPIEQFFSLRLLVAFLIFGAYIKLCFFAWKKRWFAVIFSLVWFLTFLLPSLIFVNSIGENLFAERHVFASTIGFSILIVLLFKWLWKKNKEKKLIIIIFFGIIFLTSFAVIQQRNILWRSDISLFTDTLTKSPDADSVVYNLALAYQRQGNIELAKQQFIKVIERKTWKDVHKAYNNLGNIYRQEGNFDQAANYYQTSIKLNPMHKESYNNLGALSLERGRLLESLPYLCKALLIDPSFKDANTNFNFISSKIQGMDNETFTILHNQMLENTVFKPSPNKDALTLQNKNCTYKEGCVLMFKTLFKPSAFLFPFLIFAKTPADEVVRMRYFSFNQTKEGYQMALGIDRKFSNSRIHFYIPTCEGIYYETETQ